MKWSAGRVFFWMVVGGLLGVIAAGYTGSETMQYVFGGIAGVGMLLGAIRIMIK